MRAEAVDQVIAAMEQASQELNGMSVDQSLREAHRMSTMFHAAIRKLRTKAQFREFLLSMEDNGPMLNMFLAVCHFLPTLTRMQFEHLAGEAKAELPGPQTGRPKMLNCNDERKIIEFVSELHRHGVSKEVTYKRTAQKFGVASSTVRRVWSRRAELMSSAPAVNLNEVLQFLQNGFIPDAITEK